MKSANTTMVNDTEERPIFGHCLAYCLRSRTRQKAGLLGNIDLP